MGTDHSSS